MNRLAKPTVAFICTANSVRSILAEAILNRAGGGRFVAFSAGSHPAGSVQPEVLRMLQALEYDVSGLRSKSIDELTGIGATELDFVIIVCDRAAGEPCPAWPGHPVLANWSIPEPLQGVTDPVERHLALSETYRALRRRIELFVQLPLEQLDRLARQTRVRDIGR